MKQLIVSNGMCKHCATNSANIRSYSYKPDPLFHRVNNSNSDKPPLLTPYGYARCTKTGDNVPVVHYGHEIECDEHHSGNPRAINSGSAIASIINCIGKGSTGKESLLYTKEDGTCLLEIVSNPMSWNYWNMYGKEIFQTLFPKMLENNLYGYSAPDSGHHIHVSRNAISKIDIMKIMSFVYNPGNYDFILDISQREPSKLESWASPVLTDNAWENLSRISRWRSISRDYVNRSTAVNLHNRDTIEFRIFRGTLNFISFSKNFEFVRSLVQWVRQTSLDVCRNGEGLKSYLSYVKRNRNDCENLCLFLSRRGYGKFQVIEERWLRKYPTLSEFKFNSDEGAFTLCV